MKEDFLHFVWQYQYFDKSSLQGTGRESLQILHQGTYNTHAGADFHAAKLLINDIEWHGDVEIHLRSSDWNQHSHQHNQAYNAVVLHVVWQHDQAIQREDGTEIPVLELKNKVDLHLLNRYQQLQQAQEPIACAGSWPQVRDITKLAMLDKACTVRLERKAQEILQVLEANQGDWEETTYRLLGRNFGFKVNAEPFVELCKSLSYKIIRKHIDQIHQVEALLFGQASLISIRDDYSGKLQQEYRFLAHKYSLANRLNAHQWKFLRMRPANFPTIRLAEFAHLLVQMPKLFSFFIESESSAIIKTLRSITVSEYWQKHYQMGVEAKVRNKGIGQESAENILINTVAPLLAAYALHTDNSGMMDKAIDLLQLVKPEENTITKKWVSLGMPIQNAFDSQAIIELFNNYCTPRKCLSCTIGVAITKPRTS